MLYFQTIHTARFTFQLQELTIAQARALLNISPQLIEKTRSAFLKAAIKELIWHKPYENNSLSDLTAQERLFIETTYIAACSDTPNFVISNGVYADYLQADKQFKLTSVELGHIGNDEDLWFLQNLTGAHLEVIEERIFNHDKVERIDWLALTMAAQLYRKNETIPDLQQDITAYGDWLEERANTMLSLPESDFAKLISMYFDGLNMLTHLFAINFDASGIIAFPAHKKTTNQEGEEAELLPARFRTTSAISAVTKQLLGKYDETRK